MGNWGKIYRENTQGTCRLFAVFLDPPRIRKTSRCLTAVLGQNITTLEGDTLLSAASLCSFSLALQLRYCSRCNRKISILINIYSGFSHLLCSVYLWIFELPLSVCLSVCALLIFMSYSSRILPSNCRLKLNGSPTWCATCYSLMSFICCS